MAKSKLVLKTRKLNSLPSDLKLIAEELIISKFGDEVVEKPKVRKEKKVAKSTNSFRRYDEYGFGYSEIGIDMGHRGYEESITRFAEAFNESAMASFTRNEPGVDRRIDFHSRSSYFVTPIVSPDTRGFRDAVQRLDYENAPRHNRKATVPPRFARELMSHPDFPQFAAFRGDRYRGSDNGQYVGELFGVPIFAVEGVHPEIITHT